MGRKLIDRTGQRFGKLVVVGLSDRTTDSPYYWNCKCDCGNTSVVRGNKLRDTRSCGCLNRQATSDRALIHGHSYPPTPTYNTWRSMKKRCENPNHDNYHNYGGRGIRVEWACFADFLADMGERPEGKTIDRLDPDFNYGPGKCQWSTPEEQNDPRRKRANPDYVHFSEIQ